VDLASFISNLFVCMTGVVRASVTGPDSIRVQSASTPK